ncbi:MAG: 16S rRNA (adenine(1518)-N(6)/adenine(1519)-N(6))-dimethyltransferase RsmA [Schwartzia sp.]|nr:16S rRNA (adenine(1518)-N(6)/adenine(1519)-N(6))-dimethyltransferase RsmA [Schwartzia sp. (in: firmicutes)]
MLTPQIADKGVTKHILRSFGLHASRRLGQNFLISPAVVRGVVEAAEIGPGDHVLEIGPGIGTLTQGLLEAGAEVTAVELDKKLPAVLAETLRGYEHLTVVQGDILKTDIAALMGGEPFKVAANLPYYITTPILLALLEQKLPITRIVTMVQKEVAERMTARPGGKDYGALSVAVQYHTEPEIVLDVPPNCFLPAPEVDSSVIVCAVRKTPAVAVKDETMFFRVVKAAFGQRRKTIANALKTLGVSRERIDGALLAAGVATERRGETMSLAEFAAVSDALTEN